jgi:pimeloyl-ACP methyl ester carboxylesterase
MRTKLDAVLIVLALLIGAAALFCAYLYFSQERMLFYPRPNDPELHAHWRWKRIEINAGDHQVLEGWWAEGANPDSKLTLLYFGGNAEDVLFAARNAIRIDAKRMLLMNYRGYGGTQGKPSQQALFDDALAVYEYAHQIGNARPEDIVVMGRSLGSGVATMLAARREVAAAILITPFDSITAVASNQFPKWIVERLLRHPFPSIEFAATANVPALFLIAEADTVIPPSHGRNLAAAWKGTEQVRELRGVGHNDIESHDTYYDSINEFLQQVARNSTQEERVEL